MATRISSRTKRTPGGKLGAVKTGGKSKGRGGSTRSSVRGGAGGAENNDDDEADGRADTENNDNDEADDDEDEDEVIDREDFTSRIEQLERMLEKKNEQLNELIRNGGKEARKKHAQGKGRWRMRRLNGEHLGAQQVINKTVKDHIFNYCKYLPNDWEYYSDEKETVCGLIMEQVTVPTGHLKEDYWATHLVHATSYKMQILRNQGREKMRAVFEGKRVKFWV